MGRAVTRETSDAKALRIIGEHRIGYDHSDGSYRVLGDSADPLAPQPYTVRLSKSGEPDDCTCPAMRTCSHIKAALLIQAVFSRQYAVRGAAESTTAAPSRAFGAGRRGGEEER